MSGSSEVSQADFSLNLGSSSVSVGEGSSQNLTLTASSINGFSGTVSVVVGGLPAGVEASPSTVILTPGTAQTVVLTAAKNVSASTATVTFTASSGSLTHASTLNLMVTPPATAAAPDYTLTVAPASIAIAQGEVGKTVLVDAVPLNGFTGTVQVTLSGLPGGVTASPSTLSLTPGTAQSITLTATALAPIGTSNVTVIGASGSLAPHAAALSLSVTAAPTELGFVLSLSPASIAIPQGGTGKTVSVNAIPVDGFSGTVNVMLSGLPAGVTAHPSTLSLTPGTAQNITFTAAPNASTGDATVTLTGVSRSLTHSASLAVSVTAAPPAAGFTLTLGPPSLAIPQGGAGKMVSVNAMPMNGFSGRVNVMLSGLPVGVTANPSTLSLTPGTPQNITLTAAANAAIGNTTVTFTGATRSLTHTATLALSVTAPPPPPGDFNLSVTPSKISLTQGASGQAVSVNATPMMGFSGTVNVTLSGLPSGTTANPSTLSLTPGTPQNITLSAAVDATTGNVNVTFTGTSGSRTHTTSLKLMVKAAHPSPHDFTLVLTPPSLELTQGATGQSVSVNADPARGFNATVDVALSGLPSGVTADPSTLSLTPGTPQNVTLTAAANAATGNATVTFTGTSKSLTQSATLALVVTAAPQPTTGVDVTTYHYDNARDGLNANETALTLANVNSASFGKIGLFQVDGHVDAEPLYLSQLAIGGGTHNVLYVVTEHGSIYAFDADSGTILWQKSALGMGETTSDNHNCSQISPEIGITDTPVIDRKLGAIFFVAMTKDGQGAYHQRLHALNLTTGAEMENGPTEITASYPGTGDFSQNGMQVFAPGQYAERVGLLLMNGSIFLGWTSHCDDDPYTGWLMMYNETTLKQTSVLNLTANGPYVPHYEAGEGSIWQAGAGLAGDAMGNVYFLDANGVFDISLDANGFPSQGDYGNAFMKVSSANNTLTPADYFNPYNTVFESLSDRDLGSGGVLLLPDLTDGDGATLHLAVGAGKDGNIYVVNRDNMGKFNLLSNDIYQELPGVLSSEFGMAAYFNNTMYYGSINNVLQAFTLQAGKFNILPSSRTSTVFAYPGTTPGISANGTQNGIVWALESGAAPAVLHAYDASNLGHELYNSNQAAKGRDSFGNGNKFITPMIVNGKVFVGTPNGVAVFGLLK